MTKMAKTLPFIFLSLALVAVVLIIWSPSFFGSDFSIVHHVPVDYVGVYWREGALLNETTEPGFHLKMPFLTKLELVQVIYHTDTVLNVACRTKEGVMIYFDKINVLHRLHKEYVYQTLLNYGVNYNEKWIHDKIRHKINDFCTSHSLHQVYIDAFDQIGEKIKESLEFDCARYAPGIEIKYIFVPKPTLPDSIRLHFEQLEVERIELLISAQRKKRAEMEAEIRRKRAIIEAERNAIVSKIIMEYDLSKKSFEKDQEVENQMFSEMSKADAYFYKLKLSLEYFQL